jgi:cytochrome c2
MTKNNWACKAAIAILILIMVSCTGGNKAGQGKGTDTKGAQSATGNMGASGAGGDQQMAMEVKKGNEVFSKSGCLNCHKIGDEGGNIGPDLSKIGQKLTVEQLTAWIPNPKAVKPDAKMPPQNVSGEDLKNLAMYLAMLK